MLFGDLRAAEREAPAARLVDKFPGLPAIGVLERAAAGLAAQRLAGFARGGDAVHLGLNGGGFARSPAEARGDDDAAVSQV